MMVLRAVVQTVGVVVLMVVWEVVVLRAVEKAVGVVVLMVGS